MILVTGISLCFAATVFYNLGRSVGRDAEVVMTATRVATLKDLVELLDPGGKMWPLFVSVSGRVGSDAPIDCEVSGLRGVIIEKTVEQYFLNRRFSFWVKNSNLIHSTCKETPWYLVRFEITQLPGSTDHDGTASVLVDGARGASEFRFTVKSEVFEKLKRSLVRRVFDWFQGLKMLGIKNTERVLPIGTRLTIVGEAVKDDNGEIRIQQPLGCPFYVSHKTFDQLVEKLGRWPRICKHASMVSGGFGVGFLAIYLFSHVKEWMHHREMQKRKLAPKATRDNLDVSSNLIMVPGTCVICMDKEYDAVFDPCGHMCCCMSCISSLASCPLCRHPIDKVIKTFRS